MPLERIVSGGQTGAERGALDSAIAAGVAYRGFCPRGRLAEGGTIPPIYVLTETTSPLTTERTRSNVKAANGTAVFTKGRWNADLQHARDLANEAGFPILHIDLIRTNSTDAIGRLKNWIGTNRVRVLNVTGSTEGEAAGIEATVRAIVGQLLTLRTVRSAAEWVQKWRSDIKAIYKDMVNLLYRRKLFRRWRDIVREQPRLRRGSLYLDWIVGNYTAALAAGVRRHTDLDPNSASLGRLLQELLENPTVFTREVFVAEYTSAGTLGPEIGNAEFDDFADGSGNVLDSAKLEADKESLKTACDGIRQYVNGYIAHLDSRTPATIPTFANLDTALDCLNNLVKKYYHILTCIGADVEPQIIDLWELTLMFPWIEPDEFTREQVEREFPSTPGAP